MIKFDISHLSYISLNSHWDKAPDISRVSPINRRRLSTCAKMAFDVINSIDLKIPIIFSSYVGEINRCFDLLENLKNEVSPTSFSLSVLNATAAQLNIALNNHSPILAISAKASFEMGVLSALRYQKAYVISYFEGIDKPYYKDEPCCVMIGALVSRGAKFSLNFKPSDKTAQISEICFLQNHKKDEWIYHDGAFAWEWRREF